MKKNMSWLFALILSACGGDVEETESPLGGSSSSSSSSSSSGIYPIDDTPVIPARIQAKEYTSQSGEDDIRQGDTVGACKDGIVDLVDEGEQGCAIGYTKAGESVTYKVWAPVASRYDFNIAASSGTDEDSYIDVLVNDDRKMTLLVKNNGWSVYEPVLNFLGAKFKQGENTVTFVFNTGKTNLLWFEVNEPRTNENPGGPIGGITGDVKRGGDIWQAQCAGCHAGINTPALADADLVKNTETIELLVASIHTSMPFGAPSKCENQCAMDVALFIESANPFFGDDDTGVVEVDRLGDYPAAVGPVVAHPISAARLTQTQYNNTVRDLFDTDITLPDDFPADARIGLFRNDAYSLFISLSHLKPFDSTAQKLVDEAFVGSVNANVVSCDMSAGEACARAVAETFGKRLWRRPVTTAESSKLVNRYKTLRGQVASNKEAIKYMVKSMLMSPHFLYRIEIDTDLDAEQARLLNNYELASRLSYFLWSSSPDDVLLDAAGNGDLLNQQKLLEQVDRMLQDPKAASLVDLFAAQWLDYPAVLVTDRNPEVFPQYDDALKASMVAETRAFIKDIFENDRPIREILTANYTYLNQDLASLYGVSGPAGDTLQRYDWSGNAVRAGVMGHASVLSVSAGGSDNPAPVVRGTWVLDRILCKHPRPPSPDVLASFPVLSEDLVGRERVETHRTNPVCASCHALMDPIGFGLENFDSIGAWRDQAYGAPIDSTGDLPGGVSFSGPQDLKAELAQSAEMPFCFSNHLASFALGRKMDADGYWRDGKEPSDYPFIYSVYTQAGVNNHRFSGIVKAIVLSDAFRKRRGANLAPTGDAK